MKGAITRSLEMLLFLQTQSTASGALADIRPSVVLMVRNASVARCTEDHEHFVADLGKLDDGLDRGIKACSDVLGEGSLRLIEVPLLDSNHGPIRRDAKDDHPARRLRVDHSVECLKPFALKAERPLEFDALRLNPADQFFKGHGLRLPLCPSSVRLTPRFSGTPDELQGFGMAR
ncbi:MAG: hypothetical protein A2Y78_00450 [Acidobacteria bacterium RBG_13_68_16]|nr:MAG: hypothetical protein A2Y78_00450 [Acidobacteria bacterium RBG_13_68_16]